MRGLPRKVKRALEKARDSALLAVEVYNKPAVKFKSGGYITLMVIAWTALFHAIFFKKKRKPFRKDHGRFVKIDNDFKYWELDECLAQHFKTDTENAVRKNLEFFIPLRNRIEHRSMPELDANIFGECQAMLLNFDEMLEKEFGAQYRLRESLSFSLQLFPSSESLAAAVAHHPDAKPAVDFIEQYRSAISPDIYDTGKYSFKAFLIQVANHESNKALAIQFVNFDKLSDEDRKNVRKFGAMVKFKEVPVPIPETISAGGIVKMVQTGLGNPKVERGGKPRDKFNLTIHARCWKRYKVRPPIPSSTPEATNLKYCAYDPRHHDYGYTQAWADFLIEKLKDTAEFDSVCRTDHANATASQST
ncbi:MAG: DUF3644 domain-containing protein [Limisphaerales bacterium]